MNKLNHIPPKWPNKFLEWYCSSHLLEEIQGDAYELFSARIKDEGIRIAKWKFIWDVLRFFRWSNIRKTKTKNSTIINMAMLLNYFKIGLRNLQKHRLFTFINIFGLAVSMTVGLIIISMVNDLLSFDTFHSKKDNIYRVVSDTQHNGYINDARATTVMPIADFLETNQAGVKEVVRIRRYFGGEAISEDTSMPITGYYVDDNFFKVFSFDVLKGNVSNMLTDPYSIVLTQSVAVRLFKEKQPIGELLNVEGVGEFKITGIIANPPQYSHLQFEVLASYSSVKPLELQEKIWSLSERWDTFYSAYVYLLLEDEFDVTTINKSLETIASQHYVQEDKVTANFRLQSINDIVPGEDLSQQIGPKFIYLPIIILSGLAFAILLSACFNYTNLSIARSFKRAREVGIRKVVGGRRHQIFFQFIIETVIVSLFALSLAVLIFILIRPYVLSTIPRAKEMFTLQLDTQLITTFIGFALFAGLLAGVFPASYLSKMKPVTVLKSVSNIKLFTGINIRKALIVFQFVLSLIFILGVSIVHKQYRFSLNHDLGFEKENILNLSLQGNDPEKLTNEFSKIPEVNQVSYSNMIPGTGPSTATWVKTEEMSDSIHSYYMAVSRNYIPNLNIDIVAGSNFPAITSDKNDLSIIVNQTFLKSLDLNSPFDALDEVVNVNGRTMKIIGVVKDFHYAQLEDPIKAFFFRYNPGQFRYANVKVSTTDIQSTLRKMEEAWIGLGHKNEFNPQFFDDQIEEAYGFYLNVMRMFGFLAFLAISISSLGLLGMSVYTVESRTKEIGIRKVMGASERIIIYLLSKGFVKLILIASAIASIIVYFVFEKLILAHFAYKASVGLMDLLVGIMAMIVLCLLIIVSQTQKAAKTNPAETLKVE